MTDWLWPVRDCGPKTHLIVLRYGLGVMRRAEVLLAALEARRPTRDIDLAARALENSVGGVLTVIRKVAEISLDDGLEFDSTSATAEVIREEDDYSGVRVTLTPPDDGWLAARVTGLPKSQGRPSCNTTNRELILGGRAVAVGPSRVSSDQ